MREIRIKRKNIYINVNCVALRVYKYAKYLRGLTSQKALGQVRLLKVNLREREIGYSLKHNICNRL